MNKETVSKEPTLDERVLHIPDAGRSIMLNSPPLKQDVPVYEWTQAKPLPTFKALKPTYCDLY